jgi:hypothetical protein
MPHLDDVAIVASLAQVDRKKEKEEKKKKTQPSI